MSNRTMVAGNWKMNTTPTEGKALAGEIIAAAGTPPTKVVFGVPAIQLMQVKALTSQAEGYYVAAQNICSPTQASTTSS